MVHHVRSLEFCCTLSDLLWCWTLYMSSPSLFSSLVCSSRTATEDFNGEISGQSSVHFHAIFQPAIPKPGRNILHYSVHSGLAGARILLHQPGNLRNIILHLSLFISSRYCLMAFFEGKSVSLVKPIAVSKYATQV